GVVVTALTALTALATTSVFRLEHVGLFGNGFVTADDHVTDDRIVVTEVFGQLFQCFGAALDVEHDVVSFVDRVDRVSQLTATPIFQTVNLAAVFFDQLGVTLNHRVNLLALVRVNQKYDFVMTHFVLLTGYSQPPKMVWQGVELRFGAAILGKWLRTGKEKREHNRKQSISSGEVMTVY